MTPSFSSLSSRPPLTLALNNPLPLTGAWAVLFVACAVLVGYELADSFGRQGSFSPSSAGLAAKAKARPRPAPIEDLLSGKVWEGLSGAAEARGRRHRRCAL